jgi:hypothetical protein
MAACDANDDGQVRGVVTDAIYLLTYGFIGGIAPPAPFPSCGCSEDAKDAALGCRTALAGCL